MSSIKFVFPLTGARVGPIIWNDPPAQMRGSDDPERSYTRVVVQTTDGDKNDEIILTFKHAEPGSTIASFTKSTTDGSVKRIVAEGTGFKYRTFFQFITKASGVWTIKATLRRGGQTLGEETIRVRVLTTTWPFVKVVGGEEVDVHDKHGATLHGFSWFRPMDNPIVSNHNIPTPDRHNNSADLADPHDALDFHIKLARQCRAPFSGKIVHKHLVSNDPGLGHYIHLDGKIVTTNGTIVRYRACIAHFTVTAEVGDQILIGQSLGKQATKSFLHFAFVNLDDTGGPQPVGCITGSPALLPPTGHGTRADFLALSSSARKKVQNWQSATAYYASMRDNIREAMLQKRFGH